MVLCFTYLIWKEWYLCCLTEVYGRVCNRAAKALIGKDKPVYKNDRHDQGDICIVLNAEKMFMAKKRMLYKELIYHTGYVGGLKRIPFKTMIFKKPEILVRQCVYRMLPKNKKRFPRLRRLFIYRDQEHRFPFLPKVV
jgi:large subunit ribosomal protein L13